MTKTQPKTGRSRTDNLSPSAVQKHFEWPIRVLIVIFVIFVCFALVGLLAFGNDPGTMLLWIGKCIFGVLALITLMFTPRLWNKGKTTIRIALGRSFVGLQHHDETHEHIKAVDRTRHPLKMSRRKSREVIEKAERQLKHQGSKSAIAKGVLKKSPKPSKRKG